MKRCIFFLILFLRLYIATAVNYHIQPNGSDSNDGLSFSKAFKTIQIATNKAKAGDSIFVYDGFYKGFDHFYKSSGNALSSIVYLAKGNQVIINQSCGRGFDGINVEGVDYIELIGFKVKNISDPVGNGEDGIRAVLANHITIRNCEVDSCYRGIFTGYTDDFLAEKNLCKRSYGEHGIYVSNNSDRVVIRYNQCYGNKAAGIQLNPDLSSGTPGISVDVKIYNNICYNNRIGLNLQGIYHSEVYNNLLYNNGANGGGNGMTFFLGDAATGCNNVKVYNNTVIVPSGSQWAVLAIDSDSLFFYNNIFLSYSQKGSLDIESSCTNIRSDYNLLTDKMTINQGSSYINFAQWRSLGYDLNSSAVSDISSVFENSSNNDFHLNFNSIAKDKGTTLVSDLVKDDLEFLKRPQGKAYDIGCYEVVQFADTKNEKISKEKIKWSIEEGFIHFHQIDKDAKLLLYDMRGALVNVGTSAPIDLFRGNILLYVLYDKKGMSSGKLLIDY
ncbi:MAG: right-handed parallel beta-helix repeat-containing protein [Saprospiraceae bacterium]|jgi:hypothetical protein